MNFFKRLARNLKAKKKAHYRYNWRAETYIIKTLDERNSHLSDSELIEILNKENKRRIEKQRAELVQVTCACCSSKNWYHPAQNACTYSPIPNYGCKKCQGIPSKKGR